jgi:glycosyltransferase involved in cell wall biosynthesis
MTTSLASVGSLQTERRSMRVLHAIGSVSVARGGPSVALFNTIDALRREGIDSEIVTTDDDGDGRRLPRRASNRPAEINGVRTHIFPRQTRFYSASLPMLSWLYRNTADYDVVHAHALFNFAPGVAAATAASAGVPYVIRPAGVLERWGRENRRPWLKRNSLRFFEGPLLSRAAAVQFTSEAERVQAQGLSLPPRQVVIPLAVPITVSTDQDGVDAASVEFAGAVRGRPWLLFLSRLDPKKGIERLLDAFALVRQERPDLQLLIAGRGTPAYEASLRARASRLALDDHVRWVGFVEGARKHWLMHGCTAFVLPSSSENFGVAAVEAMAAGRPVIVSHGVAVSEIVARRQAGEVTTLSPMDIAAAIGRLLRNPIRANAMGSRGRTAVADELSSSIHGKRLAGLYHDIIAESARQHP